MKIKPNIDIVNALIRITVGLTIVSWSTAKLVKRPWRDSYLIMTMLGAMKVAEGIVRFCPLTLLYERYMQNEQNPIDSSATVTSRDSMEGLNEDQMIRQ
ncbi:DUF2892 domain-containing protein [Bacillus sp. EB600]|uniref:YgaP family membrane protein n=1 Tax=Bacillus sp. EB600 TaxID=2806345 RepID=UPI00210CF79C|nr:DUF2892 domain-containing protein [Bacillus sp. EB600]MCQ6280528.1 DUF2892 domain-containing protein [Bacillus sp. EB600]